MDKIFDLNYINKLVDEVSNYSLTSYDDLPKYNLFLSQVVDYLSDKFDDKRFTTNVIQNYIRDEVITKPEDGKKRGYSKAHLIQLILLGYMKPLLTTEEIKKVFSLAFNKINDNNDDILSWEETYKVFTQIQEESLNSFLISHLTRKGKFSDIEANFDLKDKEKDKIRIFLLVLSLISEASIIKKLVQKIINEYPLDYS